MPLLAVALSLLPAGTASAADGPDGTPVGLAQSDTVRVVNSAQSEVDIDPDSGSERRLVDRESSERIDAVVIALWTIAGVMTVLLGLFLWHTSPRRRVRLAGIGSAEESGGAGEGAEPAEDDVAGDEPGDDSGEGRGAARTWNRVVGTWDRILAWVRSRTAGRHDSGPAGDGPEPESGAESVDESVVWRFDEQDGEERSV